MVADPPPSAPGHPRDHLGRTLPDPAWPPGREAPGDLEFVRRFLNTRNRENGADRLAEPAGVAEFLTGQGRRPFVPDRGGHGRLLELREALHGVAVAHGRDLPGAPGRDASDDTDPAVPGPDDVLGDDVRGGDVRGDDVLPDDVLAGVGLGVRVVGDDLVPVATGATAADRLASGLVVAVLAARTTGDWVRLKACAHCRWVVWDGSRNRSSRWCSMGACGGRHNARTYRRRRRDDG